MVWCSVCSKDQPAERDDINGFTCCTGCGRVLDDNVYSSEPTFCKTSTGQSQLSGNIVRGSQYGSYSRLGSDLDGSSSYTYSASHERTLDRGRNEIRDIADALTISGRDDAVGAAHRLYVLAVEKSFTKGRRTQQVAAACLYIVCRQDNKPYLLIDFSDVLQINVYVLGAVFLQLCLLLRLEQHPMLQKPVDPSLFIHRFTDRLLSGTFGKKHHTIANTALRIVASMKRDWIQTGRRPSGICGAALYISAQIHGFDCTKSDVVSVVHVCEATLTKRLVEFGNTESGSLTPEEFEAKAKELELQMQTEPVVNFDSQGRRLITEILCEHKVLGAVHHAHGLCKSCYEEFIKVSGGLQGESAPPAFQKAERERFDAEKRKLKEYLLEDQEETPWKGKRKAPDDENVELSSNKRKTDVDLSGFSEEIIKDFSVLDGDTQGSTVTEELGDPESLSDIDDEEVEAYLNNEDEVRLKTIVWTEMNKDWLEELEIKEAAIAASEAAQAAALSALSGGSASTADIAAAAAAAITNSKKPKKSSKRADKNPPAESAAEAARQMLERKKLGSRVNFDVLDKLFNGEEKNSQKDSKVSEKRVHFSDEKTLEENTTENGKVVNEEPDGEPENDDELDGDEGQEEQGGDYSHLYEQQEEEEYYEEY